MYLTLALVVLIAAIVTLFSQEFISIYKRIMAIKGAKLFLPLAVGSWAVLNYNYWVLLGIYYYREVLNTLIKGLAWIMPFGQFSSSIATILILTVITIAPIILLDLLWHNQYYKAYPYSNLTRILIWVISVFTVTII